MYTIEYDSLEAAATIFLLLFTGFMLYHWGTESGWAKGYQDGFTKGSKSKPYDPKKFTKK